MQIPYANVHLKHWNPGASMPLILPVHLVCNTDDALLHANIKANAHAHNKDWVRVEPAHEGVAILCGSGPSLHDSLNAIHAWRDIGAHIFALNGAAAYLNDHGLKADYQVIIDARPQTATLVGPAYAHLFASQVHPDTFARMSSARLWHLQIDGIDQDLPDYARSYALIGGGASVGNTATCLAYALGYRELHCFGYDSSHREGAGHAFHQAINEGDPCCVVEWRGREYTCSLTMKLQAEKFMETSRHLKTMGTQVYVHGTGLLPDMYNAPVETMTEKEKYQRVWMHPEYRLHCPGEDCVSKFIEVAQPKGLVLDFGCGTGRAGLKLKESGLEVLLIDFVSNSRDVAASDLPFLQWDLSEPIPASGSYGFCTDVLEHIPPPLVDTVIHNIMRAGGRVFFQIALIDDNLGLLIGQSLHLSVHPFDWWIERFEALGYRVSWSAKYDVAGLYYVTQEIAP